MENTENVNLVARLLLGAVGVAAFGYFMFAASAGNGPLGTLLYLPLFAVYFLSSATRGWDPVVAGVKTLGELFAKWSLPKNANAVSAK